MTREEILLLSDEEVEKAIEKALVEISKAENYCGKVFQTSCVYFVIRDGEITEMPSSSGCSPHGGNIPDIISGLSEKQEKYIEDLMNKFEVDEYAFDDMIEDIDGDVDALKAYIEELEEEEDEDNEELIEIYKYIKKGSKRKDFPFENAEEVLLKFKRYGLEKNVLYYEWEGMFIDLYDNVLDVGESRGEYDCMNGREWLFVLTNLENYIVKVDY